MSTGLQKKEWLGIIVLTVVLIVAAFLVGKSQRTEVAPRALEISVDDFKRAIQEAGLFSGGPEHKYEDVGRQTFAISVSLGLMPDHQVLDIGAGSLRTAWWYLQFIKPENFHAIEPARERIDAAAELLDVDINIYYNDDWEFPDIDFDFVLARSIWTHASKGMIAKMISEFAENSSPEGRFLTSVRLARNDAEDYKGTDWVGKFSSKSDDPGMIRHSLSWVRYECQKHDLEVEVVEKQYAQTWLVITRKGASPLRAPKQPAG